MYFHDRFQAGKLLEKELDQKYRYEDCIGIALNEGSVLVGVEICKSLHCLINLLLIEEIYLPNEPEIVGALTIDDKFSLSKNFSSDFLDENREFIEEEKIKTISKINAIHNLGNVLNKKNIMGRNVILISDGLKSTLPLEVAYEYLKPLKINKLVIATAIATVDVVDWMHMYADEVHCLDVIEGVLELNHYYKVNTIPNRRKIVDLVNNIILNWK